MITMTFTTTSIQNTFMTLSSWLGTGVLWSAMQVMKSKPVHESSHHLHFVCILFVMCIHFFNSILLVKDEFPPMDLKHDGQSDKGTAAAGDLLQTPSFLQSTPSKIVVADLSKAIQDAIGRTPSHKPVWRVSSMLNFYSYNCFSYFS